MRPDLEELDHEQFWVLLLNRANKLIRKEQVSRGGFIPSIRSVFRSDFDSPQVIRFHQVGGDLKVLQGEWRFAPQPDGDVRVTYENRVAAPFNVPGPIARLVLRHDVPIALMALRREAMAKASAFR